MEIKIGFTATREGISIYQKQELARLVKLLQPSEVHHGLCQGGDAEFHDLVRALLPNCKIVGHPPTIKTVYVYRYCDEMRRPKSYLDRNKGIVDETNVLIGCPLGKEILRSGTWSTIRYAKKLERKVYIIPRESK